MARTSNQECARCGCGLDRHDVRQLALYYHHDEPALLAVQYVCPRCGATGWQRHDPAEWLANLAGGWEQLAAELELETNVAETDEASLSRTEPDEGFDPRDPISVDEVIAFGERLERLSAADLQALWDSVRPPGRRNRRAS